MANYIVKGDYWDMWGVSSEEEAIVDMAEIERLASEWEKSVEELLEQVDEVNAYWYAAQRSTDDEWGNGSYDLE